MLSDRDKKEIEANAIVDSVDRDETSLDLLDIKIEKKNTALIINLEGASALRKSMHGNKIDPVESIKAMEQLELQFYYLSVKLAACNMERSRLVRAIERKQLRDSRDWKRVVQR
ncbi:hypothetical protein N0V94_003301 [Neodidymelliopsis sp. IMI 364377]|nr:hypothetical protein N0V94_003301 [Neodidymelliopsis sp. IMI 364377]